MVGVKRKKKFFVILILTVFFLMLVCGFIAMRFRGGRIVHAKEDVIPEAEIVMYRQDDERWADETLGDSSYTMGESGCLVTCIAAAVTMEGKEVSPAVLNETFSAQHVYDEEGNLVWDNLRDLGEYEVEVFQNADEETVMDCLKAGKYPIVRVRMHGIGNFHYVLVVKAENGVFYCMDPLENGLTALSEYANRIFAVRCVSLAFFG